jgi:hypothetical protein
MEGRSEKNFLNQVISSWFQGGWGSNVWYENKKNNPNLLTWVILI